MSAIIRMALEFLLAIPIAGITTFMGIINKIIRYLVYISKGLLQMTVISSNEGLHIQLHNRTSKPIKFYKVILSRTATVYRYIHTSIDEQVIDIGKGQSFIIDQKDLELSLTKVKNDLKLEEHKILKKRSTKIPIRLYFETSEGGMYSQWLLFREEESGF